MNKKDYIKYEKGVVEDLIAIPGSLLFVGFILLLIKLTHPDYPTNLIILIMLQSVLL